MYFYALNSVNSHNVLPSGVYGRNVRQKGQRLLNAADFLQHLLRRKSQPFCPAGRVATFQNSTTFCGQKKTASFCRINFETE